MRELSSLTFNDVFESRDFAMMIAFCAGPLCETTGKWEVHSSLAGPTLDPILSVVCDNGFAHSAVDILNANVASSELGRIKKLTATDQHCLLAVLGPARFKGSEQQGDIDALERLGTMLVPQALRFLSFALWCQKSHAFRVLELFWVSCNATESVASVRPIENLDFHDSAKRLETTFKKEQFELGCHDAGIFLDHWIASMKDQNWAAKDVGYKNQLVRAVHLVNAARTESELPYRIAALCTALECLLSRDQNDPVAHVVAERIAILLGDSRNERIDLFRDYKRAYEIRSRFVHGGMKDFGKERLYDTAEYLENILRRLFETSEGKFKHEILFDDCSSDEFRNAMLDCMFK